MELELTVSTGGSFELWLEGGKTCNPLAAVFFLVLKHVEANYKNEQKFLYIVVFLKH